MPMADPAVDRATWFPFVAPRAATRLRLFCFPHAGAGATIYRTWQSALPEDVEVWAVQLAGRENRFAEQPHRDMESLMRDLLPALRPHLDLPFALVGYSMGAAIAHETALRLADEGHRPQHLFACARVSPLQPPDFEVHPSTTDAQIWQRLAELGGMPEAVLANPELRELLIPQLRGDLELNFAYRADVSRRHACPVTAFGGRADPSVTEADLDEWAQVTTGPFRLRMFDGGHFFIRDCADVLLGGIGRDLAEVPTW